MNKLTYSLCAAFAAATLCAAEAAPTLESGGTDWASRLRVSANGFGRFGTKGSIDGVGRDRGELWGMGLDVQFNLLPKERFNLWLGVGTSYVPEQELCTLDRTESAYGATGSTHEKLEVESYDFRVMLIPEYKVCDALALGLRLGVGVGHTKVKESWTQTLSYAGDTFGAGGTNENSDTSLIGIVGLQATWNVTDHFGLFAYADGHFGADTDIEAAGAKIGSVDGTSFEAGIGLHWVF